MCNLDLDALLVVSTTQILVLCNSCDLFVLERHALDQRATRRPRTPCMGLATVASTWSQHSPTFLHPHMPSSRLLWQSLRAKHGLRHDETCDCRNWRSMRTLSAPCLGIPKPWLVSPALCMHKAVCAHQQAPVLCALPRAHAPAAPCSGPRTSEPASSPSWLSGDRMGGANRSAPPPAPAPLLPAGVWRGADAQPQCLGGRTTPADRRLRFCAVPTHPAHMARGLRGCDGAVHPDGERFPRG